MRSRVRSISLSGEVRAGAVEESEAAEGATWACACWSASASRGSRPTKSRANGADALAERAVAMALAAPEDQYAPADANCWAQVSRSRLIDPAMPDVWRSNRTPRAAESAALSVKGQQIGRRKVRRRRHRRHGAGDEPRLPRRLSRLAPFDVGGGDCRRRHRHGALLRFFLHAALGRSRSAGKDPPRRGGARSAAAQSAQVDTGACRWCSIRASPTRWSCHLACDQRLLDRAQTSS